MAEGPQLLPEAPDGPEADRRWWLWLLAALVALALLVPAGLWFLAETAPGRALVAQQVAGIAPKSGLRFVVGRLDGNLLSEFTLRDVEVRDLDGTFAVVPQARVRWRPLSLLGRQVSVDELDIPQGRLLRRWRLNPADPNEPLLPDIDIHVGRFRIGQLVVARPVVGLAESFSALGRVEIRAGRALVDLQAAAARGDRLTLLLDAEPDADRFDLKSELRAPAGGFADRLTGLGHGAVVELSGAGTWARWRGRLAADLAPAGGGAPSRVADLAIVGEDGRFRVRGEVTPGVLLPEALLPLVRPALAVDVAAGPEGDRLDLRFTASSDALALAGGGGIDLKQNLLHAVRAEVVLKRPALLDPRLSAADLRATVSADGPLRSARIGWTLAASRLRLAGSGGAPPLGVDGLAASGTVVLPADAGPVAVPFALGAERLVGLPAEVAALAARPRLSGTLMLDGKGIRIADLKAATAAATARGSAAYAADGRLSATIDAQVPRLAVPQVGPATVEARVEIVRRPGGPLLVNGRATARALKIDNAGLGNVLGGLPVVSAAFRLREDGVIAIDDGRLTSPGLKLAGARATFDPATGAFTLAAAGRSTAYGPVALTAGGTLDQPRATLTLASPDFGVGLRDLVATIEPTTTGFAVAARGGTPQGPLEARVLLTVAEGQPLGIDIPRATLAGLEARGRLVQLAAGPFSGRIDLDGRGLEATLDFGAEGKSQRIDVGARARNARLPLDPPVVIGSGGARLRIVLVPGRPVITGDVALKGVRYGQLVLTDATGTMDIAGEGGSARMVASGRVGDSAPFTLRAVARSTAEGYALMLDGSLDRLALKLERPARLVRREGGFELLPARLLLPHGRIDLAGTWGKTREARLAFDKVDLGLADYVGGRLGLGGTLSGAASLRLIAGAPLPQGEANFRIDGMTRSGLTGLSSPVDLVVAAQSSGDGLALGARVGWQGNDLGRVVARVAPGPGDDMAERFFAGRLSGGVRYNGPVEPLWALVGAEGQELKGPVVLAADFAGTVAAPQLAGVARGQGMLYRNGQFGTTLSEIGFDGRFDGPLLRLSNFSAKAGGGRLSGGGEVNLAPGDARRVALALQLDHARLADSDLVQVTLTGPLRLDGAGADLRLSGDLRIESARVRIVQMQTAEVPTLKVRRAGDVSLPPPPSTSLSDIALAVRVRADDRIRVEGMGLDSLWRADIRVRGTAAAPMIFGQATLAEGEFTFASSVFDIATGRLTFNGAPMESALNIQAETVAQDVTARINIGGTASRPDISFSSTPSLPEDEILSRLLFGTSVADLSVTEAVQLASAVAGLRSGVDTMSKIRRGVGLDRLRLVGENKTSGMQNGLALGKRLTRNVYVEVLTDAQGNTLTTVQWTLSRIWSIIGEVSSLGHNSLNARYQKEY